MSSVERQYPSSDDRLDAVLSWVDETAPVREHELRSSSDRSASRARGGLDAQRAEWVARYPDPAERVRARRDADAVHFAQRQDFREQEEARYQEFLNEQARRAGHDIEREDGPRTVPAEPRALGTEAQERVRIARQMEPRYFRAGGTYWSSHAGEIAEVGAVEREWIEAQERRGHHVLTDQPGPADHLLNDWGMDSVVGRLESTPAGQRLAPTEPRRGIERSR